MLFGIESSFAQWIKISPFGLGASSIAAIPNGTSGTNLFVAGKSVYRSTDNGSSWENDSTGLGNSGSATALAVSGGNLFAVTGSGVYLSTDTGATWVAVNTGLPRLQSDSSQFYPIKCIIAMGHNVFVGLEEGTWGGQGGVYLSTNNGTNWNPAGLASSTYEVFSFATSGTELLAATGDGVFSTTDNGQS